MAAEIIAVTQQKGGVGKSTIAMHLGAAFHEKGKRVLVVDADGQNTLIHWASAASDGDIGIPFAVVNLSEAGSQIHREIKKFVADYDIIVVDCPPSITEKVSGVVLLAASVAVIPTSSSPADYWSSIGLVKLVQQAQVMREKPRRLIVARIAPRGFPVLSDEASRVGRRRFDLAHVIEHALDKPQIADPLRSANLEAGDEFGDRGRVDRREALLPRAKPIEKLPPLRLIDQRRRATEVLLREPRIERDLRVATPVFALLIEQIGRGRGTGNGVGQMRR